MDYIKEHHRCWEEGYRSSETDFNTENPYDFIEQHYEYSAWEAGYYWYAAQVH